MRYYKLVGHTPVPVDSLQEWGFDMISGQKLVAETMVGDARISTIFSGFDLTFGEGYKMCFLRVKSSFLGCGASWKKTIHSNSILPLPLKP